MSRFIVGASRGCILIIAGDHSRCRCEKYGPCVREGESTRISRTWVRSRTLIYWGLSGSVGFISSSLGVLISGVTAILVVVLGVHLD